MSNRYATDSPDFGVHANGVDFEKAWNVLDRYSVGYLDILQIKTLYHYAVVCIKTLTSMCLI